MIQIHPKVHQFHSIVANQYLIVDGEDLILIDTGLPGNGRKILNQIRANGQDSRKLETIVITHADGDHYGAANELKSFSRAKILASAGECEAICTGTTSRPLQPKGLEKISYGLVTPFFHLQPTPVDGLISPGQMLPYLGGLEILDTAGHTPAHISLYSSAERILFAGDSIQVVNGRLMPSAGGNTWDLNRARQSFEKQLALKPRIICAGHGFWVEN